MKVNERQCKAVYGRQSNLMISLSVRSATVASLVCDSSFAILSEMSWPTQQRRQMQELTLSCLE